MKDNLILKQIKVILKKYENIFLLFCLFWGLIITFVNPPFQGFDEPAHFSKIYAFTDGTVNYKKITSYTDGALIFQEPKTFSSQVLPLSVVKIISESTRLYPHFENDRIVKEPEKTSLVDVIKQIQEPLNKNQKTIFVHMIPSYTIISYLPHTVCTYIFKQLETNPVIIMYILRLCSLFLYIALIYTAIRITPVKKSLFLLLGIAPASLYVSSIINTDHLVIGLSWLLIAYTLKLTYDKEVKEISSTQFWTFFIMMLLICVSKFAYLPLCLLYLIIPEEKFQKKHQKLQNFFVIFFICLLWIICYILYNLHIFSGVFSYYKPVALKTDVSIFKYPLDFIITFLKTTVFYIKEYFERAFCDFGCSDTQVNKGILYSYFILVLSSVLFNNNSEKTLSLKQKGNMLFVILTVYVLILSANYFVFELDKNNLINGFKGRYLLPVLPLFFMLFDNKKIKPVNLNITLISLGYAFFFMIIFVSMLINRYF